MLLVSSDSFGVYGSPPARLLQVPDGKRWEEAQSNRQGNGFPTLAQNQSLVRSLS